QGRQANCAINSNGTNDSSLQGEGMCNEDTLNDDLQRQRKAGVSRRRFNQLTAGVGLAMLLPRAANAQDVQETEVEITTPDGSADCYFVHPASGSHPGVIIWPDILGLRPAFRAM